ncbi:MAG: CARDB domain-containing protein [Chitinophagaceae bacterium]
MKKILLAIVTLLLAQIGFAQTPETENNNSFDSSMPIAHLQAIAGTVGDTDADDYFVTSLPVDGTVRIIIQATNIGGLDNNSQLYLNCYDRRKGGGTLSSSRLANNTGVHPGQSIFDTIYIYSRAVDTFYFRLLSAPYYGGPATVFSYNIKYQMVPPALAIDVEPNGDFASALTINENENKTGHIAYAKNGGQDDADFYKTMLPRDGTLKIMVQATNNGNNNQNEQLFIRGYDRRQGGGLIFAQRTSNNTNVLPGQTITDTFYIYSRAADSFYFRLSSEPYFGGAIDAFSYKISYQIIDPGHANDTEPNGDFATALPVTENETKTGHVGYAKNGGQDDADFYKTNTLRDGTIKIMVQATNNGNANQNEQLFFRVYDKRQGDGLLVAQRTANNTNVQPGQTITDTFYLYSRAADSVYFRLSSDPYFGGVIDGFSYKFSYQILDPVHANDNEPNDDFSTALAIDENQIKTGHVAYAKNGAPDDADFYLAQLPKDGTIKLIVQARNNGNYANFTQLFLRGYDGRKAGGNIFTKNISNNTNVQPGQTIVDTFYYTGRAADSFYFRLSSNPYYGGTPDAFSYQFKYMMVDTSLNDTEPNDAFSQAINIDGGQAKFGHVNYEYRGSFNTFDYYKTTFSSTDSLKLYISAKNQNSSTSYDRFWVTLFDKNLNQILIKRLANRDDLSAGEIVNDSVKMLITAPDTIYIRVHSDRYYGGTPAFSYNLSLGNKLPDADFTITGSHGPCPGVNQYKTTAITQTGLTWHWAISGGGTISFTDSIANITWTTPGTYNITCYLSNETGNSETKIFPITVNAGPPATAPVVINTARTLTASTATSGASYQWFKDGVLIDGATDSVYYAADAGTFTAKFSNGCGVSTASNSFNFSAAVLAQSINFPHTPDITMSATAFAKLNATASSGLTVSYQIVSGPGAISNDTLRVSAFGTVIVKALQIGNNSYGPAPTKNDTIMVVKGNQTISFTPIPNKILSSTPFAIDATASSGLPVTYTLVSGNATLNGYLLTTTGVGMVQIKASQAGNAGYNAAPDSTVQFCVGIRQLDTINGPKIVCPTSLNYSTKNVAGALYQWTVGGGGALTPNGSQATVVWSTPGTYTVSVAAYSSCDTIRTAVKTLTVTVTAATAPDAVTGMLPANNATALNLPLNLSWVPGANTSKFDLYVWPSSQQQPAIPVAIGISDINYSVNNDIALGTSYSWRVVSKNECLSTNGSIQTFTASTNSADRPDLVMDSIAFPSNAIQGQEITVTWRVKNIGVTSTNNSVWQDRIYISTSKDLRTGDGPPLLGEYINQTYLQPGQSYTQTQTVTIPKGLTGSYYLFVITDNVDAVCTGTQCDVEWGPRGNHGSSVAEANEDNNYRYNYLIIDYGQLPDVKVKTVAAPTNVFSGTPFNVTYSVKNEGPVNAVGQQVSACPQLGWNDRFYISKDAVFNAYTAFELPKKTIQFFKNGQANCNAETQPYIDYLKPDSSYFTSQQLTFPHNYYGAYYVYVVTNGFGEVYEGPFGTNNVRRSDLINVTPTPPADLVVANIVNPPTTLSGTNAKIKWTVNNQGANAPKEFSWVDSVYICSTAVFSTGGILARGANTHSNGTTLESGTSYTDSTSFQIPNGVSGNYYVFVRTDANFQVFEYDQEGNNLLRTASTFAVQLNPPVDLIVTKIQTPDSLKTDSAYTITYTLKNQGVGNIVNTNWVDKIYVSLDSSINGTKQEINSYGHPNGSLLANDTVRVGTTVTISSSLALENKKLYFFVTADATNTIYEHLAEGNNTSSSAAPTGTGTSFIKPVILPPVETRRSDLIVTSFTVPANKNSGDTITISYTVKNRGSLPAFSGYPTWNDYVYLSSDSVLNDVDALLKNIPINIPGNMGLMADSEYSRTLQVVLPLEGSGSQYIFVKADANGFIKNDSVPANNISRKPITITASPSPDLIVTNMSNPPATVYAGSQFYIYFTITNSGTVATNGGGTWYDGAYFSAGTSLSGGSQSGSSLHTGHLAPGASYSDSILIKTPAYLSGNYYLILRTDNSDNVYEGIAGNDNNAVYKVVNIVQNPNVSDLIVSSVAVPDSVILGKSLTSTMFIKNIGTNAAVGNLNNGLYLSQNNLFESTIDKLVSSKQITNLVILPGDSISTQISGRAIVNTAGNYFGIARTNISNTMNEGINTNNNTLASSNTIRVDATPLTIGTPKADTVELNNARYFKVTASANKDLQITLSTNVISNGTNAVFVAYNRVPTPADFDASGIDATALNQKILVSDTKAGDYYIRVTSVGIAVEEPVSILVQELPFSIVSISPNMLGQSIVSTKLYGAGFKANSQVVLRNNIGQLISTGTIKKFENSTKVQVGWNFTNTPNGTYDLVVINPGGIETIKPNAITVGLSSGYQLRYTQLLPENLRLHGTGILTFKGKNTGNIDIPVVQGDFSVESYVNVTNVRTAGIRKQSEFFKGASYADYITDKSDSLDWAMNGRLKTVPVFGRNIAPGDEFEISFNVSGFTGSDLLIQPRLYGYDANLLARTQLEFIETARILSLFDSALLSHPENKYLKLAQAGPRAFSDTVFATLFKTGFMEAADTMGMNINYACSRCMRNLPATKPGFVSNADTTIDKNANQYNAVFDRDYNLLPGQTMQVRMKRSHYWPGYGKAKGTAGTPLGWNKIHVNGKLDVQATSGNRLKIDLASINYVNQPGKLAGWFPVLDADWVIMEADSGITNFSVNKFLVDNTKFSTFNRTYNGQFTIKCTDTINGLPTKIRLVFISYTPKAGEPGVPGIDGIDGIAPDFLDGEDGSPAGNGGTGAKGGNAGRGGRGINGGKGGDGGRGGDGGYNGGPGGDGGAGGEGGQANGGSDNGGPGGNAGPGGDAGAGPTAADGGDGKDGGRGGGGNIGGAGGKGSNGGHGNAGGADGDGGAGGNGGPGSGGDGVAGQGANGSMGGNGGPGGPPDPCKKKKPGGPPDPPQKERNAQDELNDFFDALKGTYPGTSIPAAILNALDINYKSEDHPGLNLLIKAADLTLTGLEVAAASTITTITVVGEASVILVEAPVVATSYLIVKTYNVAARAADYGVSTLVGGNGEYFGRGFVKDFIWTTDFATSPADILAGTAKFFFGNNQPPGPPATPTPTAIPIKKPCDPNEIVGPKGFGTSRMVSSTLPMGYSIHFENDSLHASVAAQRVVVMQPIDAKADPLTFKLADFNFGGKTFSVPQNQSTYSTVLNLDSLGYRVEVTAGLDIVNRQAFWVFQTIDIQTGLPPANPLLGFLPINDPSGKGTGFVNYTIKPLASDITGDSIYATASIVFDINDPIPTNTWLNIVDAVAPTSSISNLPPTTFNPSIDLHFTGTDDAGGSGLKSYTLYVTDNGNTATTFVYNMERSDTTFVGLVGHTYAFFSVSVDQVGNIEPYAFLDSITILSSNLVTLCPNTSVSFPANITGTGYQWQLDTGSGFTDLTNTGVYTGANTATLSLTNAPSTMYGYAFRCQTGPATFSQVYTLKFEMTWEGTASTAWENAANWSCGALPDAGTDVVINGGKLNYPRLNADATIRSLKINNGATGRVMAGNKLTVIK